MTLRLPKPTKRAKAPKPPRRGALPKRGRRPRQRRSGLLAALEREADRLFSLIVRSRSLWCERCRVRRATDTAHVFTRRYAAVRHAEENAFGLCRECHQLLGSANTKTVSRMEVFFCSVHGSAAFARLRALALVVRRFDPVVLDGLRARALALGHVVPEKPARIPF